MNNKQNSLTGSELREFLIHGETKADVDDLLEVSARDRIITTLLHPLWHGGITFAIAVILSVLEQNPLIIFFSLLALVVYELSSYLQKVFGISVWSPAWTVDSQRWLNGNRALLVRDGVSRKRLYVLEGSLWRDMGTGSILFDERTKQWLTANR